MPAIRPVAGCNDELNSRSDATHQRRVDIDLPFMSGPKYTLREAKRALWLFPAADQKTATHDAVESGVTDCRSCHCFVIGG